MATSRRRQQRTAADRRARPSRARGVLATAAVALAGAASAQQRPEAGGREMIAALPAAGPHHALAAAGDRARAFDRFVGAWDAEYVNYAPDGTATRTAGEVLFGWIIDGWALQDIWIERPASGEREIGTTIRFYDPRTGAWRITWIDPARSVVQVLSGGPVGDRIVLRGTAADGRLLRWTFHDIRDDRFGWRGESSHDQGETWRRTAEYVLRRRAPAGP